MDIHAIQGDTVTHVLTMHRTEKDDGPVQLVSAAKVAYWMQREVDYEALLARLEGTENKLAEDCQLAAQPVDSKG